MAVNAVVYLHEFEHVDSALRRLSKALEKSGMRRALEDSASFRSKGERRRLRRRASVRRIRRDAHD